MKCSPYFLAILLISTISIAKAQLVPFPDTLATWSMTNSNLSYPPCFPHEETGHIYFYGSDTIVDGIAYNTVYRHSILDS